ncbi:transport permease protein [Alcaligenes pakistanensis]|uniref:Transport permease protein n=1 Tax=Alcaligenes pakistanensis TaxID=1482717 RepID=A0A8H9M824_9BURK|nr:ABC transporter permease [Alcaligenes pakistanensis]GHC50618.1 transport permease protein [Alcaligenes pakistanensis]
MTNQVRSPMAVTWSVWRALFLREALDRLFDMRAAWFWLLMEPVLHISFITFIFTVIRLRTVGGIDVTIWLVVGLLSFFMFRRTSVQVMHAADSNKPLFAYRQVHPFDTAIARASLEAFLMTLVAAVILTGVALLGHEVRPDDPLQVFIAVFGLWLFGVGYGLIASVLMALVRETEHILKIIMMPLYLISGVIMPISAIPQPFREMLLFNPLVHGLEFVRQGFSSYYHMVPGVSLEYLYVWGVVSLFLGLLLYRRFTQQLVMK